MRGSREEWIRELVQNLQPVRPALSPGVLAAVWLLGSWTFVTTLTLATGPLRPGVGAQLSGEPQFLLECLFGLAAGVLAIYATGCLSVPSPTRVSRQLTPALALLALWLGVAGIGLLWPAIEPSMLGKRAYCYLQVLIYSGPPLWAALWLLRRAAPLDRVASGVMSGIAAGALPALMMQLACMYDPAHMLGHHLAPIAATALLGAVFGRLLLRRI